MRLRCKACTDDHYETMVKDITTNFGYEAKFCPICGRCLEKPDFHKIEPVVRTDRSDTPFEDVEESHPSYAQLSFHRCSGGYNNFYGSSIKHQEFISLQIKQSVKHSSPYNEHYYAYSSPIIEVHMSQAQFAEAITTMNMGEGVPVTLYSVKGEFFPKCPEANLSQKVISDLDQKLNEFADSINTGEKRVNEILNKKGAINKKERNEIAGIYGKLMQDLKSNLPFLHECMNEAYDKTTMAAKADIEAFYVNAINRMGMEALELKKLTESNINDDIIEAEEIK